MNLKNYTKNVAKVRLCDVITILQAWPPNIFVVDTFSVFFDKFPISFSRAI